MKDAGVQLGKEQDTGMKGTDSIGDTVSAAVIAYMVIDSSHTCDQRSGMYILIESLCLTLETNGILCAHYTQIQKKN